MPEKREENRLAFDPSKEVTPDDWKRLNNRLKALRENAFLVEYAKLAGRIRIIDPERKPEFGKVARETLIKHLGKLKSDGRWVEFLELAANMKTLDPAVPIFLTKQDKVEIEKMRQRGQALGYRANANIVYSEGRVPPDKQDWQNICAGLSQLREHDQYSGFAEQGAEARIVFQEESFPISKVDWDKMRERLASSWTDATGLGTQSSDPWGLFAKIAANMTILAASRVHTNEWGLQITMRQSEESKDAPPQPETLEV